jgi:hypothetical protein
MSDISTFLLAEDVCARVPRWHRYWQDRLNARSGLLCMPVDNQIVDLTDDAIRVYSFNPLKRLLLLENIISFAELGDVLCLSSGAPQINSGAP